MADAMSQASTPQRGKDGEIERTISVFCRVRPQNNRELRQGEDISVMVDPHGVSVEVQSIQDVARFDFDAVVGQDGMQADMYALAAHPVVEDFLQGYNGTVFAYGQTGSGKTYTMEGVLGDREKQGLVPRMVSTIFRYMDTCPEHISCSLQIQFLEIYNEKIRDLLTIGDKENLRLRGSQAGNIFIDGASSVQVSSELEMLELMEMGASARATAETVMNEASSRSHSLFILTLEQTNSDDGSYRKSKLFLVDLAGSEILRKTGAEGATLKEAQYINKSLSALNKVISSLADGKSSHIPYRDSKLTRILEEAIGGNCRTALIVCCAPTASQATETLSTMRFGKSAKRVKNKARINKEQSPAELKLLLADVRKRLKEMESVVAAKDYEINLLKSGNRGGDATVLRMVEIKEEILRERESRAQSEAENRRLQARIQELEAEHEDQLDDLRGEVERLGFALGAKEQEQRMEQATYAENLARTGSLPANISTAPQQPARARVPLQTQQPGPAARGRRGQQEVGGGGLPIGGVAGGVARRGAASHMWDAGPQQQQQQTQRGGGGGGGGMSYAEELRAQMEAAKARKASEKAAEREAERRQEQQRMAALEQERATAHLRRDKFGNVLPGQHHQAAAPPPPPPGATTSPGRRRAVDDDDGGHPLGGGGFASGFGQADGKMMRQQENRLGKPAVAAFADYQEELRQQMEDKKRAKQREKEEELAWERRQEERMKEVQAEMAAEKAKEKPIKSAGGGMEEVIVAEGPKPKGGAKWEARNAGPPKASNLDDYHEELRKQMEEKQRLKQKQKEQEEEEERKDAERLRRQQEELKQEEERDRKMQADKDAKKAAGKAGKAGGGMGGVLVLEGPKPVAKAPSAETDPPKPPPAAEASPKREAVDLGAFVAAGEGSSKPKSPPQHGRRAQAGSGGGEGQGDSDGGGGGEELLATLKEDMRRQQQRLEELMKRQAQQLPGPVPAENLKPAPIPAANLKPVPAATGKTGVKAPAPEAEAEEAFPVIYPLDPKDLKYLRKTPELEQGRSRRERRTEPHDEFGHDDFDQKPTPHPAQSGMTPNQRQALGTNRLDGVGSSQESLGGGQGFELDASSAYLSKHRQTSEDTTFGAGGIFAY